MQFIARPPFPPPCENFLNISRPACHIRKADRCVFSSGLTPLHPCAPRHICMPIYDFQPINGAGRDHLSPRAWSGSGNNSNNGVSARLDRRNDTVGSLHKLPQLAGGTAGWPVVGLQHNLFKASQVQRSKRSPGVYCPRGR